MSSFIVPGAIFVKHEVQRNSFAKVQMEERFVKLPEAVQEKR